MNLEAGAFTEEFIVESPNATLPFIRADRT
ncbi:hypothetical protein ICE98_03397 [Lactococcus lactis]|nr:hypothetical protein [Lactococcus lactis]